MDRLTHVQTRLGTYDGEGCLEVSLFGTPIPGETYVVLAERDNLLTVDLASLPDLIATLQLIQAKGARL